MLLQMSKQVQEAMNLRATLIDYFMNAGLPEYVAKDFAGEAVDKFVDSGLASKEVKDVFGSLNVISVEMAKESVFV